MRNKLILTDLPVKQGILHMAVLMQDDKPLSMEAEGQEGSTKPGQVYLGQVRNIKKYFGGIFIDVRKGCTCYMQAEDTAFAVIPSQKSPRGLSQMDEILVQVTKEAGRGKDPCVSSAITLNSANFVLQRGNRSGIGISKKLQEDRREELRSALKALALPDHCFLTVRTSAGREENIRLLSEARLLCEEMRNLFDLALSRPVFSLLRDTEPFYRHLIAEAEKPLEIRTDDAAMYERCTADFGANEDITVSFYEDRLLPMYKLYRLETYLERALAKTVHLKSGGTLVIEPTTAFISVDVNSGKNASKEDPEQFYLNTNLEAAAELMAQLRLRNLSGMILVDFISMRDPESEEILLQKLREMAFYDPAGVEVIDITALGIAELTRRKIRKPLAEQTGLG